MVDKYLRTQFSMQFVFIFLILFLSKSDLPIGVLRVVGFILFARQHHHRIVYPIDNGSAGKEEKTFRIECKRISAHMRTKRRKLIKFSNESKYFNKIKGKSNEQNSTETHRPHLKYQQMHTFICNQMQCKICLIL